VAKINKHLHNDAYLSLPDSARRRARATRFDDLTPHEQEALIEYARVSAGSETKVGQSYFKAFLQAEHVRQTEIQNKALRAMAVKFVEAER
jgi:hypothetical protein